jgi:putative addiction module killer protein
MVSIGECVIDWGPGYRIYLAKAGHALILLFGSGTKATQLEDVRRAVALHQECRGRRRMENGGE